jgi:hypothetical protein
LIGAAEDYHTNDYPDEPALPEDEDDEYSGVYGSDEDEDEDGYSDSEAELGPGRWRPWKPRTIAGEEEYDLDDSDEDEEPTLRKMTRSVWSLD